jgi:hypothetical protein
MLIAHARLACSTAALLLLTASPAAPPRAELGKSVKLRILVDKVMQPTAGWVTQEWMVKAAAQAGFNVFSPRHGHDRLDEVRQVAEWCAKYDIYYMPWMRGTLEAPPGPEANGKRLLWASGNEQPLWSPNSDEFWQWTNRYIVEYARISASNPHLMGVFLDYENYAPGSEGNCYELSYDDIILAKFAAARGLELPHLEPAQRKPWLEAHGLHQAFAEFQINYWRERCRALRQAVDRYDPTFRFCVYPAPGTLFIREAIYREWATPQAPLILADPVTYGRPSRFLPQPEALAANRQRLLENLKIPQAAGIPFLYAGGIDPAVAGADPEFSGKNAVMIAEVTGGYWVFYEGPTYTNEDHAQYWKWFTWANRAIAAGNFAAQHEPRQTPEDWSLDFLHGLPQRPRLVAPPVTGQLVEYPPVRLRGDNALLLAGKQGQPVEVRLRQHPVGNYRSLLVWELRNPALEKLAAGTIEHQQAGTVSFTPPTDGIYTLAASAGSCAYAVVSANVPVGLYTAPGLSLIGAAQRLYFAVPANLAAFTITATGGGGVETVRINVRDPSGNQVASGQTTPQQSTVEIQVPVKGAAAGVWSLEVTRADTGVLEDSTIKLDRRLCPVLALRPEEVFTLAPQ